MFLRVLGILFLTITLASCGGKKGDSTKANVVILGGIASGIPGQTGGTKLYGYNNTTGDTVNITITGPTEISVPNGVWGFAAVTWDGVTGNGSNQVLEGDVKCGTTPDLPLFGGDVTINLSLSNGGCNDGFFGDANTKETNGEPKKFLPYKCQNVHAIYDDNETCIPSVAQSFIVSLPDSFGGPGLRSRCIDEDTATTSDMLDATAELRIPIIAWLDASFPIKVELYDDAACGGTLETYTFSNIYAGWTLEGSIAQLPGGGDQGDGNPNAPRFFNNPCNHGEGNSTAPFSHTIGEYAICTEAQFEGASGIEADLAGDYVLLDDLDFSSSGNFPAALVAGNFTGTFDGNGKTISHVRINATSPPSPLGLFQQVTGTDGEHEIQNLNLYDISVTTFEGGAVGTLVGQVGDDTHIERIDAEALSITTTGSTGPYLCLGGLIGDFNATATNPAQAIAINIDAVTMNIGDNWSRVGGIAGCLSNEGFIRIAKISDLVMNENGSSGDSVGGAVGHGGSVDTELYGVYVDDATIGTQASPFATSRTGIGGLMGSSQGTRVIDSKATGSLFADGQRTGGLIGNYTTTMTSQIFGNVADVDVVNTTSQRVGGLIGHLDTSPGAITFDVDSSRSLGSVECDTYCGGLIGFLNVGSTSSINIRKSFSRSNVSSSATGILHLGGLIGSAANSGGGALNITEVFSTGNVSTFGSSVGRVGGLLGHADTATVADTFYTGFLNNSAASASDSGALIGFQNAGSVSTSYTTSNTFSADDCIGTLASSPSNSDLYGVGAAGDCTTYLSAANILDLSNLTGFGANWVNISNASASQLIFGDTLSQVGESYTGSFFDPIVITTPAQFNAIGSKPFLMNKTYQLGGNISFGNSCHNPIGNSTNPFLGNFKGNDFTISDISCNDTSSGEPLGLFGKIGFDSTGVFGAGSVEDFNVFDYSDQKSLFIDNVHLTSDQLNVGILAGQVQDSGVQNGPHDNDYAVKISRVHISNSSVSVGCNGCISGGVVGDMTLTNQYSHMKRISFHGDITSTAPDAGGLGGIFGRVRGPIAASATQGIEFSILQFNGHMNGGTGSQKVGGVFGELDHDAFEAYFLSADHTATASGDTAVGGLIGRHYNGSIRNAYSKGSVTCSNPSCVAGGLIGDFDANTTDPRVWGSYAEAASVSATGGTDYAGCLYGFAGATPIAFNNYANCTSVTATTPSYFGNGGVTIVSGGTQPKNVYVGANEAIHNTEADDVTAAEILDPNYIDANTELVSGDPWFHSSGGPPRMFWEVLPQVLEQF